MFLPETVKRIEKKFYIFVLMMTWALRLSQHTRLRRLQNVAPSVEKLEISQNWMLQQDDDPKHTSKIVKGWLLHHCPKALNHPLQFPNPIQHLWECLEKN